jgi:hypothetical protein
MKRKLQPPWKTEFFNFLNYTKRERDSFFIFEIIIIGMLAQKTNIIFEFNILMLVVIPIIYLICSILIYRKKKQEIEKIKNYRNDDHDNEMEEEDLPF